jgi:hypothetical protein
MAISEESSTPFAPPAEPLAVTGRPGAVNPMALTVAQLARMLAMPEEKVREHVTAGAPMGADGTVNLVHYAAWLSRRMKEIDGD